MQLMQSMGQSSLTTGAGKTYSMEGPGIETRDDTKKGLVPRVIEGLFEVINSSHESTTYSVRLSMVEIYMEKVRDLLDRSKDEIQIKETKSQGISLSGVTEMSVLNAADALQDLSSGIANRSVRKTQTNLASSKSHCIYILTIEQDRSSDKRIGKLILVDLASPVRVRTTGAETRLLKEAKTFNESLLALVDALTCSSQNNLDHIPLLKDALGGRMAFLCCCSSNPSKALDTLSTLRLGASLVSKPISTAVAGSKSITDSNQITKAGVRVQYNDLPEELWFKIGKLLPERSLTAMTVASKWFKVEVVDKNPDLWMFLVLQELSMVNPTVTVDWKSFYWSEAFLNATTAMFYGTNGFKTKVTKSIWMGATYLTNKVQVSPTIDNGPIQNVERVKEGIWIAEVFAIGCPTCTYADGCQESLHIFSLRHSCLSRFQLEDSFSDYLVLESTEVVTKTGRQVHIKDANRTGDEPTEWKHTDLIDSIDYRLLPNGIKMKTGKDGGKDETYKVEYPLKLNESEEVVMIGLEFHLQH